MTKIRGLAILNVISFIIHLVVVYLIQFKFINEKDVGEISDKYTSLFTPAGFTFAIWGIIYTWLSIFCIYHVVMAFKRNKENGGNRDTHRIGYLFIINNIATAAWLIAWTREQLALSVLLIFIQLISLAIIHQRLHIHSRYRNPGAKTGTELPLSVYFGWISLATIANVSAWLTAENWDGFGVAPTTWAIILVVISGLIGIAMILLRRNITYGLVFIWGLYGIISRLDNLDNGQYMRITSVAWGTIIALFICVAIQIARGISFHKPLRGIPPQKL